MKNSLTTFLVIAIVAILMSSGTDGLKQLFEPLPEKSGAAISKADGKNMSKGDVVLITARKYHGSGRSEPGPVFSDGQCESQSDPVTIDLSYGKYPASARHMKLAWQAGAPRIWHIDRLGADENREQSLQGIESNSTLDRDEVPIASSREGGTGANVAYIPLSDNRGSGAYIGNALSDYCDGQSYFVRIVG